MSDDGTKVQRSSLVLPGVFTALPSGLGRSCRSAREGEVGAQCHLQDSLLHVKDAEEVLPSLL